MASARRGARQPGGPRGPGSTTGRWWAARTSSCAQLPGQVPQIQGDDDEDADRAAQGHQGIAAHAAGLDAPELTGLEQEEGCDAIDGTVDHAWFHHVVEETRERQPWPDEEAVVELVDVVLVLDQRVDRAEPGSPGNGQLRTAGVQQVGQREAH